MAVAERTTGTPQPIGFSQSVMGRVGTVLRWIARGSGALILVFGATAAWHGMRG